MRTSLFSPSPYRSNAFGRHSYPSFSRENWRGVLKNDNSPSDAFQTHFMLISSRIPAYEVQGGKARSFRNQVFSLTLEIVWQSFGHHVCDNDSSKRKLA